MGLREFLHLSKQQNSLVQEEICGILSVKDMYYLCRHSKDVLFLVASPPMLHTQKPLKNFRFIF